MITQEELKELYNYNPSTGVFRIKKPKFYSHRFGIVGSLRGDNYVQFGVKNSVYLAHILAWIYMTGEKPKGEIDHINGLRSDNRFCNLRDVPISVNSKNKKTPKHNTSGHIGVFWHKRMNKWYAKIGHDSKQIHLGYFDSIDEAVKARKCAEKEYSYHSNHGR